MGPVDNGSPAELAGLHRGDEIIEVQGTNVQEMKHNDVVALMRENPDNMTMLVSNAQLLASTSNTLNSGKAVINNGDFHSATLPTVYSGSRATNRGLWGEKVLWIINALILDPLSISDKLQASKTIFAL